MRRAVLLALLLSVTATAPARAGTDITWESAPPVTEAQAPGLARSLTAAVAYWRAAGAPTIEQQCGGPLTPQLIGDSGTAAMWARPRGSFVIRTRLDLPPEDPAAYERIDNLPCRLWIEQHTAAALAARPVPAAQRVFCVAIVHEVGHTLGYTHEHVGDPAGVMAPGGAARIADCDATFPDQTAVPDSRQSRVKRSRRPHVMARAGRLRFRHRRRVGRIMWQRAGLSTQARPSTARN